MSQIVSKFSNSARVAGAIGVLLAFGLVLGSASPALAATSDSVTAGSVAAGANLGKLVLKAVDELSGVAVADAMVVVWDVEGTKVARELTNAEGTTTIELAEGLYKVRVYATGYESYGQSVSITAGQETTVEAQLKPSKAQ